MLPPDSPNSDSPLRDLLILDLSRVLAGPFCTQMLADFGATVIKVERPGRGDDTRQLGPPFAGGESAYFLSCNRSKQSLTLDLSQPEGQRLAARLAAKADVLIENFKVGTTEKWGLGYETLAEQNPGLVYCSISAYGQDSSERNEPGYDFIIQARGGIMSLTGPPEGPPQKVGVAIADITAGLYAASGILAALHERQKSGKGQHIDVSLLDTQVAWLANAGMNYLVSGEKPQRRGNAHPNIVPYEVFETADTEIAVAAANDAQFGRLAALVGLPELVEKQEYATNADRVANREALVRTLNDAFQKQPAAHWLNALRDSKIAAVAIQDLPAVFADPVVRERRMVREVEHPSAGPLSVLGPAPKFSRTPTRDPSPPPLLGEHTESILQRYLAMDAKQIGRLRHENVV